MLVVCSDCAVKFPDHKDTHWGLIKIQTLSPHLEMVWDAYGHKLSALCMWRCLEDRLLNWCRLCKWKYALMHQQHYYKCKFNIKVCFDFFLFFFFCFFFHKLPVDQTQVAHCSLLPVVVFANWVYVYWYIVRWSEIRNGHPKW